MPRREGAEPLINCLDIPCPWEKCFRQCKYRVAQRGKNGFPNALCSFYSTPGPHVPSRIARATGLTIDAVNKTLESAHAKMRAAVAMSDELQYDPQIRAMVQDHLEGIPA